MTINGKFITADENKVLTNGTVYGKRVRLGNWDTPENWREITEEEYNALLDDVEKAAVLQEDTV